MNSIGKHTVIRSLEQIPAGQYTGYLWISDEATPRILEGEPLPDLRLFVSEERPANPFLLEAQLFDATTHYSIAIRHLDGQYRIDAINWNESGDGETREESFIAHSAFGARQLRLRTAWIPKSDPLCENFAVLTPAWCGFVGFKDETEG
jgi:CRISPR type III-associated protein (TIGR04423 family)